MEWIQVANTLWRRH